MRFRKNTYARNCGLKSSPTLRRNRWTAAYLPAENIKGKVGRTGATNPAYTWHDHTAGSAVSVTPREKQAQSSTRRSDQHTLQTARFGRLRWHANFDYFCHLAPTVESRPLRFRSGCLATTTARAIFFRLNETTRGKGRKGKNKRGRNNNKREAIFYPFTEG